MFSTVLAMFATGMHVWKGNHRLHSTITHNRLDPCQLHSKHKSTSLVSVYLKVAVWISLF